MACIYNQHWQNSGNFSSISSISSNSSSGGGAASRHVNSFKSTSSSVPQSIYYVKGVGEGGGLLADIPQYIIIVTRFNTFTLSF